MSESGLHTFWRQKAFLENPGLHKITADVTVAVVVIVVFTRWHFEMYKNTMGQIKNTTNEYWGCFLVECVQETCNFLRTFTDWRRVYQRAHGWAIIGKLPYIYNAKWLKVMIVYGLN